MRFLALAVLFLATGAGAAELRSGEAGPAVAPGEVVQDDVYATGATVTIDGEVRGDVVVAGGEVDVRGPVGGDVLAAGGTVRVSGAVAGSVRAAGGTVVITGTVQEDVIATGGEIDVTGRVGRDVVGAGGTLTLGGVVGRHVNAGAGTLNITGTVGGDVRAEVGQLELAPSARVSGRLVYGSEEPARIADGAVVGGGITREQRAQSRTPRVVWPLLAWLRRIVAFTVLGLLFRALAPGLEDRSFANVRSSGGLSLLIGLAFLVGGPLAATFAIGIGIAVGGFWIGLFALVLWALILALGVPLMAHRTGEWVAARRKRSWQPFTTLLVGVVILTALPLLPWVGHVALGILALVGAGALVLAVARWRPAQQRPVVAPTAGSAP